MMMVETVVGLDIAEEWLSNRDETPQVRLRMLSQAGPG